MGFLLVFTLLIEAGVLLYLEWKAWETLVTPLYCLAIPYLAVLFISIILSGRSGFVEFHYPSILIWIVGLLLFAVPSFAVSEVAIKCNVIPDVTNGDNGRVPGYIVALGIVTVLLFAFRLFTVAESSKYAIGSDDFAMEFSSYGFWGHLRHMSFIIIMFTIYYLDKCRRWLWVLIVGLLAVNVVNMVKGSIIIPCVVGVMMRIVSGKTKITGRFLLVLSICAVGVFFITFLLAIVVANRMNVNGGVLQWIFQRFVHYLTSGTLGLSVDMQLGFPDRGPFQVIWTPFINIVNQLCGNGEILSPVNPTFHFTGISLTNVRTFFGTLFIYTDYIQFCLYSLGISAFCYSLKVLSQRTGSIYTDAVYCYFCGLLAMGWFEFYLFHIDVIEIPVMVILLHFIDWALSFKHTPINA
ncbi:MAG: DUF6337 family protein [Bacteroidaceae bacterium]|nr:DUF6337 family protein [Bacteroidaceae bacterium]